MGNQARCVERVVGGAGTGKTQFLLDSMDRVRAEYGIPIGGIAFTTFTRAGCEEMATRAASRWHISGGLGNFRTVHSMAYKGLKIEASEMISDDSESLSWVSRVLGIELEAATSTSGTLTYKPLSADSSDEATALTLWTYARATLRPMNEILAERLLLGEQVPSRDVIEAVVTRYESAKRIHDRVDYSDILLRFSGIRMSLDGPRVVSPEGECPEGCQAVFADESQDNSAAVDMALLRLATAPGVRYVLLAGDPMQCLYESFGGGSARHFMAWKAVESIMPRSYRCPPQVHELGEQCLKRMTKGYWDRGILPADHQGAVKQSGAALDAMLDHVSPDEHTLVLARCEYSLREYAEILDDMEIPFSRLNEDGTSVNAGFAALQALHTGEGLVEDEWAAAIRVIPEKHSRFGRLLEKGTKSRWELEGGWGLDFVRPQTLEQGRCGATPQLAALIREGDWSEALSGHTLEAATRWKANARRYGPEIATRPRVRLGTIHSAKGQEADTVILSTQSSRRVETGRSLSDMRHDEECRVNYVAVTRARRKLVVVEDGLRERIILPW